MSSRLRNLQRAFAPIWYPGTLGTHYAGMKLPDPVLADLHMANLSRAIADGSVAARVELGIAIAFALREGNTI